MSTSCAPARRWPREYRETAYELYAGPASQSVTKVANLLSQLKREVVPVSTVHRWKDADHWQARFQIESPVGMRNLRDLHLRELMVAAVRAVDYLVRVISGEEEPNHKRIRAAIAVESASRAVILQAADHQAAHADAGQSPTPMPDLSGMTMEELVALEERRRRERQIKPHRGADVE